MVSRRKILSQSRDELSYVQEEEEDVWYTKDKLYKVYLIDDSDKYMRRAELKMYKARGRNVLDIDSGDCHVSKQ